MKVSRDMRLSWLQRWQSMDKDGSKLLDYTEFVEACGLRENMWSWRMFNLLDKNFVGKMMQYYCHTYIHIYVRENNTLQQ